MDFNIITKDKKTKARAAVIKTERREVQTPIFMPVGTQGSVKSVHQKELETEIDAPIILGNTYHLNLRPGIEILKKAGGLHKFMNWNRLILTDSGGYQVYSLAKNRKISEEGVKFQSHIDGSSHFFSPERAMDIQRAIGGDFIMSFDECTPYPCNYNYAKNSMQLTHKWLIRSIKRINETEALYDFEQTLFPIVQGSVYKDLRTKSAEFIANQQAKGNAIGGLSVGEPHEIMYEITQLVCDILPEDKPRYLMGVGTPANILESIALGVDMFDCVMPSRNARHGLLYTAEGIINIKNKKWENDFSAINKKPLTFIDDYYSKAYIRHLVKSNELLANQITTINNLAFYIWLVKQARKHIIAGDFPQWKEIMMKKVSLKL